MRNLFISLLPFAMAAAPGVAAKPAVSGKLYPGPAPGSEGWMQPREAVACNGEISVYNTSEPRYDLFLPDARRSSGAAVLLLPGGGLRVLGVGAGSDSAVQTFLDHGVAVMRLEYRTLQVPAPSIQRACAPRPTNGPPVRFSKMDIRNGNANPAPGNADLETVLKLAIADAQTGLELLHKMAPQWRIDPGKIGVIGESAGGGVAFGTIFATAAATSKPAFLISIFGPSLQDVVPPENAPPIFLATEADHGPVTDGLVAVFSIWKNAGLKAELHVYEVPNFSMTPALWGPRLFDWMIERGILSPKGASRP
ncbi:MAG: alpha/beta hydrolase fold domain-containing protein [Sphingobium sp.]|nr:alpha/beta hydrolase fold domain-containing protein [Sphingobium sp.]